MDFRFALVAGICCAFAGSSIALAGSCGNGTCESFESSCDCPQDCPNDPEVCDPCDCGDHGGDPFGCYCDSLCSGIGDCCGNFIDACGQGNGVCGNGVCEINEDACSCPDDCGTPGVCDPCECGFLDPTGCWCDSECIDEEDCCPGACDTCGVCEVTECGNQLCEFGEDSCGCPADCPDDPGSCSYCECGDIDFSPTGSVAGNGCYCDPGCESRGDCCFNQCQVCGDCNGACCLGDNETQVAGGNGCVQTTFDECEKGLGGSYQGDGTLCDSEPCNRGACCISAKGTVLCEEFSASLCEEFSGSFLGVGSTCGPNVCNADQRLDTVKKGSLLVFPAVELRWAAPTAAGVDPILTQETFITLVNDFNREVNVKLYFVNGDAPTDPVYADDLQSILVERGHNGWNQVDCAINLTENESTYLALSSGVGGCQRFTILDPGTPPGRPSGDPDGNRVLRGFVIAFAVDENQHEISHNHLSGHADIVNYEIRSAWEYQAYAFQALNPSTGTPTDQYPGQLRMDGVEYDYSFNTLLFDFYAVGSTAMTLDDVTVMLDTDLTLLPASVDLRQDSCGPVTTKAHFDIWNANEDFRSGTTRCITCWDQTLLSAYSLNNGSDNNFILADLGTDKGKARIDGQASFDCDNLFVPPTLEDAILQYLLLGDRLCDRNGESGMNAAGFPNGIERCCEYTINDSQNVSLLGVAAKILNFSGAATGTSWAGMNLVGAGLESAEILFDVPAPPEPARDGTGDPGKDISESSRLNPGKVR